VKYCKKCTHGFTQRKKSQLEKKIQLLFSDFFKRQQEMADSSEKEVDQASLR